MTKSRDTADSINRIDSSAADATAITIDANENVGIGTSSPSAPLEISTSSGDALKVTTSTGRADIWLTDTDTTAGQVRLRGDANNLVFITNTTERMRIDSSGNVGIGTTSPTVQLATGNKVLHLDSGANQGSEIKLEGSNGLLSIGNTSAGAYFYNVSNTPAIFATNNTERMRIDSSGNLLIGTTGLPSSTNKGTAFIPSSLDRTKLSMSSASTSNGVELVQFRNPNGEVGTIATTSNGTSYNTSSDYRLKENVTGITDGIERVKQLNPSRFNFIADADTPVDGFLAHEVSDIVPEAVTGEKDAMMDEEYEVTPAVLDDDGNVVTEAVMGTRSVPKYQGIDQSKLVPLLTAALQEAVAKIETLEAKVTALENVE